MRLGPGLVPGRHESEPLGPSCKSGVTEETCTVDPCSRRVPLDMLDVSTVAPER